MLQGNEPRHRHGINIFSRDKMAAISQTDDSFKCIFWNENVLIFLKISPKFAPKLRINNIIALVQIMD